MPESPKSDTMSVIAELGTIDWHDPAAVKRLLVFGAGLLAILLGHPAGLSDLQLELAAGVTVAMLGVSNWKSASIAKSQAAAVAAHAAVATPEDADKVPLLDPNSVKP